jgi:hypothetical protein
MVCESPPLSELALDGDAELEPLSPETFEFQAGAIDAELGPEPDVRLEGGVLVRRGNRVASAESAFFDATASCASAVRSSAKRWSVRPKCSPTSSAPSSTAAATSETAWSFAGAGTVYTRTNW